MKSISLIFLIFFSFNLSAQDLPPLYKGLIYKMPIGEAKKEFRKNKEDYKIISFGNGVDWYMYPMNFSVNVNNELVGINLNSGSLYGLDPDTARVYLIQSRDFFESKGYTVIYEPEYWENPVLFDATNKYGLLLHDPDKNIMVSLRGIQHPTTTYNYAPIMGISNYDAVIEFIESEKIKVKEAREKTGF